MVETMITTHVEEGVGQQDMWLKSWLKNKTDEVVGCVLSGKTNEQCCYWRKSLPYRCSDL